MQIARLSRESAAELANRWMGAMAQQYDDSEICSTPSAVAAVSALIDLCRYAIGAIVGLGINVFFNPVGASADFGIPITDPSAFSFLWIKGIRGIFAGVVVLVLLFRGDPGTIATIYSIAVFIALGDGLVILKYLGFVPPLLSIGERRPIWQPLQSSFIGGTSLDPKHGFRLRRVGAWMALSCVYLRIGEATHFPNHALRGQAIRRLVDLAYQRVEDFAGLHRRCSWRLAMRCNWA